MIKKAISLLAAFVLAVGGSVCAFADDTNTADAEMGYSEEYSVEEYSSDEEEAADELTASEEQEKAESFAEEHFDPELGRHLEAQKQAQQLEEEMRSAKVMPYGAVYGGPETLGYTNDSLIHNSRFDDMSKVWGIDVSYFQYDIDWEKVKADGIDFAIIRLGYRGYGSAGDLVLDYKFKQNIDNARAAGLEVGIYFFTQAINEKEAVAEADFCLKYLSGYKLDLPVFYDIESIDYDVGRLDSAGLTKKQKTALCTAFCDRIIENGYEAGVYANKYWLYSMIDGAALGEKYPIWLAHYNTYTDYTGEYEMWQFTGSGKVSGINTAVDIDVHYRDSALGKINDLSITTDGTQGTLSWGTVRNATKYEVCKYDANTKKYTLLATITGTKYNVTITDTLCGYSVRPVSVKNDKTIYGDYSDVLYISKSKPNNLKASSTLGEVSLTWDTVDGASGYEIFRATSATGAFLRYTSTTENSFTLKNLPTGKYYAFKVRPYFTNSGSKAYGTISDAAAVVTALDKTTAPVHISSTKDTVTLSWNKIENATGYEIGLYNATTKSYTVKADMSASTLHTTITGLSPASSYRYAVRAYAEHSGIRAYGEYSKYRTCGTAASAPTNPYASVTPTSVKLTWDAVSGASSYDVYVKSGSKYILAGSTDSTSLTFSRVSTDPRNYVVTAKNIINNKTLTSEYSALCSMTKASPSTPSITSYSSTTSAVRVNWTKVSGADGYRVYKYDVLSRGYVKIKTIQSGDTLTYRLSGLNKGSRYQFKVKAFSRGTNGIEWGSSSSAFSAYTKP
ncbi:MAG: GH25 family lysozyme [Oscillospiraceae bacterium]